jgi:hypothetical protein
MCAIFCDGFVGDQGEERERYAFAVAELSKHPNSPAAVEAFEVNERRAHIGRWRRWLWITRAPVHDATVHVAFLMANHTNDSQTLKPGCPVRRDPVLEFVVRAVEWDLVFGPGVSH